MKISERLAYKSRTNTSEGMWAKLCFFLPRRNSPPPPVGQGLLIIEASRSHSDTPQPVGLLWTSDQPEAETSTWQHTTLTRDRHLCHRRDWNPQSQQASGRRPTPQTMRPLGSAWVKLASLLTASCKLCFIMTQCWRKTIFQQFWWKASTFYFHAVC